MIVRFLGYILIDFIFSTFFYFCPTYYKKEATKIRQKTPSSLLLNLCSWIFLSFTLCTLSFVNMFYYSFNF